MGGPIDTGFEEALRAFMRSFGWNMVGHDLLQFGFREYYFMKDRDETNK